MGSAGMGGGGSHSRSKPTLTGQQKQAWQYYGTDILPEARGKETYLTQLMAQRARDAAAQLQQQGMQGIQTMGAQSNMGASDIAALVKSLNEKALQETFRNINAQRQATIMNARQMIAGLPLTPGTTTKTSEARGDMKVSYGTT